MTDPVEERSYRWPRRCVFAATLLAVIALLLVLWSMA
jgi:hypothetical protein